MEGNGLFRCCRRCNRTSSHNKNTRMSWIWRPFCVGIPGKDINDDNTVSCVAVSVLMLSIGMAFNIANISTSNSPHPVRSSVVECLFSIYILLATTCMIFMYRYQADIFTDTAPPRSGKVRQYIKDNLTVISLWVFCLFSILMDLFRLVSNAEFIHYLKDGTLKMTDLKLFTVVCDSIFHTCRLVYLLLMTTLATRLHLCEVRKQYRNRVRYAISFILVTNIAIWFDCILRLFDKNEDKELLQMLFAYNDANVFNATNSTNAPDNDESLTCENWADSMTCITRIAFKVLNPFNFELLLAASKPLLQFFCTMSDKEQTLETRKKKPDVKANYKYNKEDLISEDSACNIRDSPLVGMAQELMRDRSIADDHSNLPRPKSTSHNSMASCPCCGNASDRQNERNKEYIILSVGDNKKHSSRMLGGRAFVFGFMLFAVLIVSAVGAESLMKVGDFSCQVLFKAWGLLSNVMVIVTIFRVFKVTEGHHWKLIPKYAKSRRVLIRRITINSCHSHCINEFKTFKKKVGHSKSFFGLELLVICCTLGTYTWILMSIFAYAAYIYDFHTGGSDGADTPPDPHSQTISLPIMILLVVSKTLIFIVTFLVSVVLVHSHQVKWDSCTPNIQEKHFSNKRHFYEGIMFLSLFSLAWWFISSFVESTDAFHTLPSVQKYFYDEVTINAIVPCLLPLTIFFHFNSFFILLGLFLDQ